MKNVLISMSVALMTATVACGGEAPQGTDGTDTATDPLTLGTQIYDAGTQCTVSGATMHCCPSGFAMIGARLDQNVFRCAQVAFSSARFIDVGTQRNNMHACPRGAVMVGLDDGHNYLACQYVASGVTFEYVDGTPATQDSYPMHVCPTYAFAMSGIRTDQNLFTCAL